jgi:transcriptional regulator with XRE-family HTH domain
MEDLGTLIRSLRKDKGLTQAALASRLSMSRATISAIENGTVAEIGIRKVEGLLNMLGYRLTAVPNRRRPTLDELKEKNFHD